MYGSRFVFPRQSRLHLLCSEPKANQNGLISISNHGWLHEIAQTHHPADSWVCFFLRTRFTSMHRDESEILRELSQSNVRALTNLYDLCF